MSRRSKYSKGLSILSAVMYLYALLIYYVSYLAFKVITLIISFIIFKKSGYKEKSGNNFFKTILNKGNKGEYQLYRKVSKMFGKENVITNVYLPSKNIDNTEIDVLAVKYGKIYCFEMKNYSGYIYGRQTDRDWTQVLKYRTKHRFFNPLRQNYAHQKALEEFLEVTPETIVPVIVFANRANLDNVETGNGMKIDHLKEVKYSFNKCLDEYILDKDIRFLEKLSTRTLMNNSVKQEHIIQVKALKKEYGFFE